MKLSIAMATYNGENYIGQQLESLRTQTRCADEVVIVDDCSADTTPNIIRTFIENNSLSNWKLTVHTKNQGCTRTFREALSLTTGDIIFLCDQDDVWLPDKIEKTANFMEENPKIQMISCNFDFVDGQGYHTKVKHYSGFFKQRAAIIGYRIVGRGVCIRTPWFPPQIGRGCCCAVSRTLCDEYLAADILFMAHDAALSNLAALRDGLYFVNNIFIHCRVHSSNTSELGEVARDFIKRQTTVDKNLQGFVEMQSHISKCEMLDERRREKHLQIMRFIVHLYELRTAFLKHTTFKSFMQYVLNGFRTVWMFGGPWIKCKITFKTIARDVVIVLNRKWR